MLELVNRVGPRRGSGGPRGKFFEKAAPQGGTGNFQKIFQIS